MNSIIRKILNVRRRHSPNERTIIVASCTYTCEQCLITTAFGIARGVLPPDHAFKGDNVFSIPSPQAVDCFFCDGSMTYDKGSYINDPDGMDKSQPYFRIPSRRASVVLAGRDTFEAQLVAP